MGLRLPKFTGRDRPGGILKARAVRMVKPGRAGRGDTLAYAAGDSILARLALVFRREPYDLSIAPRRDKIGRRSKHAWRVFMPSRI